jgi:two-component system sensor histidine kinase KdpD
LHALVNNLLDMARLESGIAGGAVNLRRDWQSVEEVVGSAIRAARTALGDTVVHTALDAELPLVEFDAVLIERVLVNLLENAAKYGAPPILIGARAEPDSLVLTVRDHGPGLPAALLAASKSCSTSSPVAKPNRHAGRGVGPRNLQGRGERAWRRSRSGQCRRRRCRIHREMPRREPPEPAEAQL